MSWSLAVEKTAKADFSAAVDAATTSYEVTPEVQAHIDKAKVIAKECAELIDTPDCPNICCSMSGHFHDPNSSDAFGSIGVNVYGMP